MSGRPRPHGSYSVGEVDWQDEAACVGVDIGWFYSNAAANNTHKADKERDLPGKGVCAECKVRIHCLEYALRKGEAYGIWGGLTTRERKALQRERARYRELISTAGRDSSPTDIATCYPVVASRDSSNQRPPQASE